MQLLRSSFLITAFFVLQHLSISAFLTVGPPQHMAGFSGCVGLPLGPMRLIWGHGWPHVGPNRGHVRALLDPCWAADGLCWGHVGTMFGGK